MILLNNYILVKEIASKDEQLSSGLILPEQEQQEDQVAQGKVIDIADINSVADIKKDSIILFHKMIPVDAQLKMENGDIERVWFIKEEDVICVL